MLVWIAVGMSLRLLVRVVPPREQSSLGTNLFTRFITPLGRQTAAAINACFRLPAAVDIISTLAMSSWLSVRFLAPRSRKTRFETNCTYLVVAPMTGGGRTVDVLSLHVTIRRPAWHHRFAAVRGHRSVPHRAQLHIPGWDGDASSDGELRYSTSQPFPSAVVRTPCFDMHMCAATGTAPLLSRRMCSADLYPRNSASHKF